MFKTEDFNKKIIEEKKFISLIKPGSRIFISSGPGEPAQAAKMITSSEKLLGYDLEIIQVVGTGDYFPDQSSSNRNYRYKTFRSGETAVEQPSVGKKDYYPSNLLEIPYIFATQTIEIDIAVITTSPPDKRGFMNLGAAIDTADTVIKNAAVVIAEVNPNVPITYGDTLIHFDQVDHIILSEEPLNERERKPYDELQDRIGWHVSNLIQDGSTVVMHVGRIFDAIASHLKSKKNLGILTNVVSDWIIDLVEAGAVSLDRKREFGGQISTSYCFGTRELYDYVDHNQLFGFYPIAKLANPLEIRSISKIISILNVEKIDITAARVLVYTGDDLLSGYESKFNFAVGTAYSGSGKVIFALKSVDQNGDSNIVISLTKNPERIRSTLSIARYVVTEYGVASLFGKSIRERALSLIEVAHPDHREALFKQAKAEGYLYPDQIYRSIAANYPAHIETVKTFKDGLELKIRPIRASDEDMMRRLFYKFSDRSKYYRYFTSVRVMPHENMQKYLSVDYDKIMSVVAVQNHGNIERIVAEARYAAYPNGETYEMAFLVDEEFHGKGIATYLAEFLIMIARGRGIKRLSALVLSQNIKMLKVFDKLSVKPQKHYDGDTIELFFDL
ncbi:MAG TPA: GNAT family N-acetyltransferase [Syntrophomonadaceae bacterium]|jgi:acyl-CoA hydrolase/GNAT superfamily N-acetyltransferase|nr:GNAT family N-acetyltransferase [Syntrophomonadaceae bacterium]HRX21210.1 GNAT family N-acetyltransferase [Syntrophomonadaceae bacterium]